MAEIIGYRVAELIGTRGLSQSELARRTGVKQPTIAKIISGQTRQSGFLMEIARALKTSPEYLTGNTDDESPGALQSLHLSNAAEVEEMASVRLPQLDISYSMGGGSVFEDYQRTALVPFPKDWLRSLMRGRFDELFIAHGQGDSMQPTLLDGDFVIVDTAQKRVDKQDRLWCISYGELGMIKRCRVLPDGGLQINSDNPAVSPITAYDGEVHVIGRVIWYGRRA